MSAGLRDSIARLIDDLKNFKTIARGLNESNSQQDALQSLDLVIASDRALQQAISEEMERQKMLLQMAQYKQQLASLKADLQSFVELLFNSICSLEDDINTDKNYIAQLKARHQNAEALTQEAVLQAASCLSLTRGPPLDWTPGSSLRTQRPPYPTEDLMLSSLLFRRMNINEPAASSSSLDATAPETAQSTAAPFNSRRVEEVHAPSAFDIMDLDLNP